MLETVKNSPRNIHVWMPNLFGFKGGIQVYSAYLLEALQKLLPDTRCHVFLMHDQRSMPVDAINSSNIRFHYAGNVAQQVRSPLYASQLVTYALAQRPDLIISTHLNFSPVARLIKQIINVPFWTVAHGVEAWNIERSSIKKGLQATDTILPVSGYTRDRLIQEQQLSPNQLVTLPNTVNTQRFQIGPRPAYLLEKFGLSKQQPVILSVSRLCATESYKSYDQVLAALPLIRQQIPDIKYIIVGKGDDRPRIERLIADKNLQNTVELAGFVPDEQLCDYYNLCDVFALPSKLEGFGIVYLEAMACGKPVLGGNQDGAVDALCHGQLGALIDPDNTHEIAQTLIDIIQKTYPNLLMYSPEALRQTVISTYGFDAFQHKLSILLNTAR